jgi:excisionase family DNA binding protein
MNALSLSIRQAADATGLSDYTIRKAIDLYPKQGGLVAKKIGTKLIIKVSDLEAWVDSLENARQ